MSTFNWIELSLLISTFHFAFPHFPVKGKQLEIMIPLVHLDLPSIFRWVIVAAITGKPIQVVYRNYFRNKIQFAFCISPRAISSTNLQQLPLTAIANLQFRLPPSHAPYAPLAAHHLSFTLLTIFSFHFFFVVFLHLVVRLLDIFVCCTAKCEKVAINFVSVAFNGPACPML